MVHALVPGPVTPRRAAAQGVRVTEVPLSTDSLTSSDVFILDLGAKVIVWAGSAATGMEKNKALTYTVALRDDRDHKGTAQVSGVPKRPQGLQQRVWRRYLGSPRPPACCAEAGCRAGVMAAASCSSYRSHRVL